MRLIAKIPYRFMGLGLIVGLLLLFVWPIIFIPPILAVSGGLIDWYFDDHMQRYQMSGLYDGTRNDN